MGRGYVIPGDTWYVVLPRCKRREGLLQLVAHQPMLILTANGVPVSCDGLSQRWAGPTGVASGDFISLFYGCALPDRLFAGVDPKPVGALLCLVCKLAP